VDLNVKSLLFCSQAVAPVMLAQGGGAIVHLSSVAARVNQLSGTGYAVYGALKAGVDVLTRSMAEEWGPTVRVNAVRSGRIDSGEGPPGSTVPERMAVRLALTALGRMGAVDDIAHVVAFLCKRRRSLRYRRRLGRRWRQ